MLGMPVQGVETHATMFPNAISSKPPATVIAQTSISSSCLQPIQFMQHLPVAAPVTTVIPSQMAAQQQEKNKAYNYWTSDEHERAVMGVQMYGRKGCNPIFVYF
jgi:hypothetical protein